jgi:hypothetical protein
MALGAAAQSVSMANMLGSLAVLTTTLFAGFLLSRNRMPVALSWLSQVFYMRCETYPATLCAARLDAAVCLVCSRWLAQLPGAVLRPGLASMRQPRRLLVPRRQPQPLPSCSTWAMCKATARCSRQPQRVRSAR